MMMRTYVAVLALCAVAAGCGRSSSNAPAGGSGGDNSVSVGRTAQAVRGAVERTVTLNELNNLRLFIDTASAGGRMPDQQQILAAAREDRKLSEFINEGLIVVTGTKSREGVWAYVAEAMKTKGFVVLATGIETMDAAQLKQLLKEKN
jgi:hypothetical protein